MTSQERFSRMFKHQEADRVPFYDFAWGSTVNRWRREGMPTENYLDYFGLDKVGEIRMDVSPRYERKVVEETDEYRTETTSYGVTLRNWKKETSTPEFLDFTIVDRESWEKAKARMTPTRDRIDWAALERDYPIWKKEGRWIRVHMWFGFDITHSHTVGTERWLMALVEDPEWCIDVYNHFLDMNIALLDMLWEAGYHFDSVYWPDDMGYKQNQFFSKASYRRLLKPVQKRACDWAKNHGVYTHLHSCGFIQPFVPDLIEIGIDMLNPLEVKAGMDPYLMKSEYGDKLGLHGGLNAVLWDHGDEVLDEMDRLIPVLKQGGGFIFASDHSIPSSVSFEQFTRIVNRYKELAVY